MPEVETIARTLREGGQGRAPVIGRKVSAAHLLWQRTLAEPLPELFLARLPGQEITEVSRRGKFLLLHLSADWLLIHLRMSGDIRVESAAGPDGALEPLKHDRLVLDFSDGWRLAFTDPRKFGRVWLAADPAAVTGGLGPEPFDPALTAETLHARLLRSRRQIKPLLLDQTFLAGLGNIYTDEALHMARIHPLRLSHTLTAPESTRLLEAIRAVLSEGIRRNGASIDWVYRGGDFQNAFQVYGRGGQPCPTCGRPVERITVGQRGTHFCPYCQEFHETSFLSEK